MKADAACRSLHDGRLQKKTIVFSDYMYSTPECGELYSMTRHIEGKKLVRVLISHRVVLMAYIRSIVQDDYLAEDVFQDVCVLAYQKQKKIKDETHLLGWLRITARYESLKAIRKRSTARVQFDSDLLDLLDSHWAHFEKQPNSEIIPALRHCLDKLTDNARRMIQLRYVECISGKALADALDRKLNTVYVALTRIHRTLADCIGHQLDKQRGCTDG